MRVLVFSRTSPYWQLSPEESWKWKLKGLLKACFLKNSRRLKHKQTALVYTIHMHQYICTNSVDCFRVRWQRITVQGEGGGPSLHLCTGYGGTSRPAQGTPTCNGTTGGHGDCQDRCADGGSRQPSFFQQCPLQRSAKARKN